VRLCWHRDLPVPPRRLRAPEPTHGRAGGRAGGRYDQDVEKGVWPEERVAQARRIGRRVPLHDDKLDCQGVLERKLPERLDGAVEAVQQVSAVVIVAHHSDDREIRRALCARRSVVTRETRRLPATLA